MTSAGGNNTGGGDPNANNPPDANPTAASGNNNNNNNNNTGDSSGKNTPSSNHVNAPSTMTGSTTAMPLTTSGNKMLVIGGILIVYNPGGTVATATPEAFYKKTERIHMQQDKRADLYEKATRTRLTVKFDLLLSTFSDKDKHNMYNVGVLLKRFRNHLRSSMI
jgi:hypothetical protein